MALNSLGQISMGGTTAGQSIALELGLGATTSISLGSSAVYRLGGFASASNVDMGSFRGKSNAFSVQIGGDRINLYNSAIAAGWSGVGAVSAVLVSDVYSSTSGTPGLYIDGFGYGVKVITNGYAIRGGGGTGGQGGSWTRVGNSNLVYYDPTVGSTGGPGISVGTNLGGVTIDVTGSTITGGAGGGGGGAGVLLAEVSRAGVFLGTYVGGGGGGGGGYGAGGSNGTVNGAAHISATAGNYGASYAGGTGGTATYAGRGGDGGYIGTAGGTGGNATNTNNGTAQSVRYGAAGGSAGLSVSGYYNVIWIGSGPGTFANSVA